MPIFYEDTTKNNDTISCRCDICSSHKQQLFVTAKRNVAKNDGQYICLSCKCKANPRPQNTKKYWEDPARKAAHSASIKSSETYYNGIKNRPSTAGEQNHNWGKSASSETRAKMSKSRTGKVGEKATAWKGGKTSFNHRIKTAIQRRYKWFHRVIDRDKSCVKCGANKQLDAHHIQPIATIIKQLTELTHVLNDVDKFEFIINHPLIVDAALENGVCLCRSCHKLEHSNWGSHEPKIRK